MEKERLLNMIKDQEPSPDTLGMILSNNIDFGCEQGALISVKKFDAVSNDIIEYFKAYYKEHIKTNDDMIRVFANTLEMYTELHSKCWGATPEECKELMTMKFPLIQGIRMQNAIMKIGKLPYDSDKAAQQVIAYSRFDVVGENNE